VREFQKIERPECPPVGDCLVLRGHQLMEVMLAALPPEAVVAATSVAFAGLLMTRSLSAFYQKQCAQEGLDYDPVEARRWADAQVQAFFADVVEHVPPECYAGKVDPPIDPTLNPSIIANDQ
jgi:hypothetical protein